MKVRDKEVGQLVSVADRACLGCSCYWPRPDPGMFFQGRGYVSRPGKREWVCGTRDAHGCPTRNVCCESAHAEYAKRCRVCGKPFGTTGKEQP